MTLWSRRVSPARVFLCGAFMALAFALASWTSANADDRGLLGTVTEAVPTVGQELATTTAVVEDAAPDVPVAPVREVVEKPVAAVDKVSSAAVSAAPKVVSHSASEVTRAVQKVAPATKVVRDPVVDVVAPVTGTVEPDPGATLPDLVTEVVAPLVPEAPASIVPAAPASTDVVPAGAVGLPVASAAVSDDVTDKTGAARSHRPALPGVVDDSRRQTTVRPVGGSAPEPRTPVLASGLVGAASGPTSAGSAATGGADLGTTPSVFGLPRTACPAVHSRLFTLTPGPAREPASQPG